MAPDPTCGAVLARDDADHDGPHVCKGPPGHPHMPCHGCACGYTWPVLPTTADLWEARVRAAMRSGMPEPAAQDLADTLSGRTAPSESLAVIGELIDWFGAPDWTGPQLPEPLAKRIADVMAGVAAGPQATPGQDEVLWHTVTTAPGSALGDGMSWLEVSGVMVPVPPGTRVRVVAVATDHEDQP